MIRFGMHKGRSPCTGSVEGLAPRQNKPILHRLENRTLEVY